MNTNRPEPTPAILASIKAATWVPTEGFDKGHPLLSMSSLTPDARAYVKACDQWDSEHRFDGFGDE